MFDNTLSTPGSLHMCAQGTWRMLLIQQYTQTNQLFGSHPRRERQAPISHSHCLVCEGILTNYLFIAALWVHTGLYNTLDTVDT